MPEPEEYPVVEGELESEPEAVLDPELEQEPEPEPMLESELVPEPEPEPVPVTELKPEPAPIIVRVPVPTPAPVIAPTPSPEEGEFVEDVSDLVAATQEDILGKRDANSEPDDLSDLTGLDEEDDDLSDLVEVSEADIMGDEELIPGAPASIEPELPTRKVRPMVRFRRTAKRYPPPPTSIGGIRQ